MASGEGRGAFYDVPTFHGVGADIPNAAASDAVSGVSQPSESSQSFGEPSQDGAQSTGEGFGQSFYSEAPLVAATFPSAPEGTSLRTVDDGVIEASSPDGGNTLWYNSAYYQEPDAPHSVMQSSNGVDWYAMQQQGDIPQFEAGEAAAAYNQATFQTDMLPIE